MCLDLKLSKTLFATWQCSAIAKRYFFSLEFDIFHKLSNVNQWRDTVYVKNDKLLVFINQEVFKIIWET